MHFRWILVLPVIFWMGACAATLQTGILAGRLQQKGLPTEPVVFSWEESSGSDGGTISTTLASGENYRGKFVRISATTDVGEIGSVYGSWDPMWNSWGMAGPDPWVYAGDVQTFARLYSGKVVATLFGDRGGSMRCKFELSAPEQGFSGGGVGECQVSTGAHIDVQI